MSFRRPRVAIGLAVASVVLPLLTSTASVAQIEEVEQAEQRVAELEAQLDAATAAYETTHFEVEAKEEELANLEQQAVDLAVEAAELGDVLATRARRVYKYGTDTVLTSLLSADGPQAAIQRASFMSRATARDQGRLETAVSLRRQLDQLEVMAEDTRAELAVLEARLDEQRRELESQLAVAQERAEVVRDRAARQREIRDGRMNGIYSCIFDQGVFRFRDTWGAARSGGRRHKGTDVFAPYDVNVYAFTNGRVSRMTNSGLGGINLYLFGDDGVEYFYAHLAGYAPGIGVGTRVRAGDLVAYNGDTGNARGTPHVHFEAHPGGGTPVNPYPYVAAACY